MAYGGKIMEVVDQLISIELARKNNADTSHMIDWLNGYLAGISGGNSLLYNEDKNFVVDANDSVVITVDGLVDPYEDERDQAIKLCEEIYYGGWDRTGENRLYVYDNMPKYLRRVVDEAVNKMETDDLFALMLDEYNIHDMFEDYPD